MPKFPRLVVPGFPHHITQRGVRRQKTFFDESDYRAYLDLAVELASGWEVEFWAYCLMPNHIHAVAVPNQAGSLSKFFAVLHRRYARRINSRYEWQGHLWQKRFYSVVMDERHTIASLRYVELNPVHAGMCKSPRDWPWSSAKANLGLTEDPLIDRSRTADIISDWDTYLASQEDTPAVQTLRRQTSSGRPDGDRAFMKTIERLSGRRVSKQRAGRKKK